MTALWSPCVNKKTPFLETTVDIDELGEGSDFTLGLSTEQ